MQKKSETEALDWILIAKGIGIILVVVGHFYPKTSPAYWTEIKDVIYAFHMPLFFLLSGYLHTHGKYRYLDLMLNKTKRLLYPFVSIALGFLLIKYVAGLFVELEIPVSIDSVYALLLDPATSYMPLLWFVHALFLIFAIYPLLRLYLGNLTILLVFLCLNSFLGTEYVVLGRAAAHLPFFLVGIMIRENKNLSERCASSSWFFPLVTSVLFITAYLAASTVGTDSLFIYVFRFLLGLLGSLLVINLSQIITASITAQNSWLSKAGYYSMGIYLFHTLFESSSRIALERLHAPFELNALISIICGVFFALMFEKMVLRRFQCTRKYVLGLS